MPGISSSEPLCIACDIQRYVLFVVANLIACVIMLLQTQLLPAFDFIDGSQKKEQKKKHEYSKFG